MKKKRKKHFKRWRKIRYGIEFSFMKTMMLPIWLLSVRGLDILGNGLGWFVFKILRVRRQVVMDNLAKAFPEKTEQELLETANRTYQNFAKMIFDYMRYPVMAKADVLNMCEMENPEHFDWILENGKGGVLISGHFGSWELMGAYIAQCGYPISFLVGKQKNSRVNNVMNENRAMMGIGIIQMGMAVRGVIKALRNNEMIALLSDQDARKDGVFVDFMGRKASTPQGPAVFAIKTGAPILFACSVRQPNGRHRIISTVFRFEHLKDLTLNNIQEVTQAYTSALEKMIRKYPDHWFWMHKRWKTRPPEEKKKT